MRFPFISGIILVLSTGCGESPASPGTATTPAQDSVAVFLVRTDTLQKSVDLPGELEPFLQSDLSAKVQGYVRQMKVDIGDHVRKGQTLAVIEAPEINTQVTQSEAAIAAAQAKYTASADKYRRLNQASLSASPGIVAPVDLIEARDQMASDSAAYEALRQQSKAYREISGYLNISAPFDGVITSRKVDPGALVSANSMLLTIQDNHILRLRVAVPEIYVGAAAGRRELSFNVDANPEQRFTGVLTRKSATIDPATRTELWEYDVDNRRQQLIAGAFVYARLRLERSRPSFVVPPGAIATTLERKFVIRIRDGKAEWIDVRQGFMTDHSVEIFGDLQTGDTLVTKASDERKPGSTAYWKPGR